MSKTGPKARRRAKDTNAHVKGQEKQKMAETTRGEEDNRRVCRLRGRNKFSGERVENERAKS